MRGLRHGESDVVCTRLNAEPAERMFQEHLGCGSPGALFTRRLTSGRRLCACSVVPVVPRSPSSDPQPYTGAPGLTARSKNATRNKCIASSNKCLTSSNKDATRGSGAPGLTARSKNATRNKCIASSNKCLTSSNKDATRGSWPYC